MSLCLFEKNYFFKYLKNPVHKFQSKVLISDAIVSSFFAWGLSLQNEWTNSSRPFAKDLHLYYKAERVHCKGCPNQITKKYLKVTAT